MSFYKIIKDGRLQEIENFVNKYKNIIKQPKNYSFIKTIGLFDGIKYLNKETMLDVF